VASRTRQGLVTLGDQSILFAAAMRGIFQRPFYVAEFLDQCRFKAVAKTMAVAVVVNALLTQVFWGTNPNLPNQI